MAEDPRFVPVSVKAITKGAANGQDGADYYQQFARLAPMLIVAVGMFGIIDAANLGFLPVYGVKQGLSQETAALMVTAFIVGNVVLQFPIGWIADHWSKRGMMSACAIATAIGSALVPWAFGTWLIWPLLAATGAASALDRTGPPRRVARTRFHL